MAKDYDTKSESKVNLPDGSYKGYWSAYEVRVVVNEFKASEGIRTVIPQPVDIEVKDGIAYIKLRQ